MFTTDNMQLSGLQENALPEYKESTDPPQSQNDPGPKGHEESMEETCPEDHVAHNQWKQRFLEIEEAYIFDIEMERTTTLPKNYWEDCDFSLSNRQRAVKWLIKIYRSTSMSPDILALSIEIFDRYVYVKKECFLPILVAIVSLRIAYNVVHDDTSFSTDVWSDFLNTRYSKRRVWKIEQDILKTLEDNLKLPTPFSFLDRCSFYLEKDSEHHSLCQYLVEMSLGNYEFCHILPSLSAAAASCFMEAILKEEVDLAKIWTSDMVSCTKYNLSDLKPVILVYAQVLILAINQDTNAFMKYESKYGVSRIQDCGLLIHGIVSQLDTQ